MILEELIEKINKYNSILFVFPISTYSEIDYSNIEYLISLFTKYLCMYKDINYIYILNTDYYINLNNINKYQNINSTNSLFQCAEIVFRINNNNLSSLKDRYDSLLPLKNFDISNKIRAHKLNIIENL